MESVPILLITGPVRIGKSSVLFEAARLLREARVPHAAVDLAQIGAAWPPPADDRWNERIAHRNLACMWSNVREAGAERLLLERVLEARSLLRHVVAAVPGARITVVRLRAPRKRSWRRGFVTGNRGEIRRGTWGRQPTSSRRWSVQTSPTM